MYAHLVAASSAGGFHLTHSWAIFLLCVGCYIAGKLRADKRI